MPNEMTPEAKRLLETLLVIEATKLKVARERTAFDPVKLAESELSNM